MTSTRTLFGGAVLATVLATGMAISVQAQTANSAPSEHGWHHHGPGRLYSQLGLSDEQKAQIKQIMTAARPQMQTLHEQMRTNTQKLEQLRPDDPNYQATVTQVSQANAPLHAQLMQQMASIKAQIFTKVLQPAQRDQFMALKAQMQAQRQAHQGHFQQHDQAL